MSFELCTPIDLSESYVNLSIYRVYPQIPLLLPLLVFSAGMLMRSLYRTLIIQCERIYVVCQLLVHGVWYTITSKDFVVSHFYMTPNAEGDRPRPPHQYILQDVQGKVDHVVDVLPICHCIMAIGRKVIVMGEFEEDCPHTANLHTILVQARNALQYRQHTRNMGVRYRQQWVFYFVYFDSFVLYFVLALIMAW